MVFSHWIKYMDLPIHFIVAVGRNGEFAAGGSLPWPYLAADMAFFADTTTKTQNKGKFNAVVMGKTTWNSIPESKRPLRGRLNIVLTSTPDDSNETHEGRVVFVNGISALWAVLQSMRKYLESVFVIGGKTTIESVLSDTRFYDTASSFYISKIDADFPQADLIFNMARVQETFTRVEHEIFSVDPKTGLRINFILRKKEK